tara:strand:+ start:148 stop:693 length:546 start_codon:yes stop_codon:yes gene_type:complete
MKLRLIKFSNVKSTNDEAIKKIKSKKVGAGIVYSYSQTKGRGTMGKKWISFNGNFFITIFFELKKNMPNFKEFSVLNPLILKKLLSRYTNLNIKIKKPNDLLINNNKVCGILQETLKIEKKLFLVIGVGVNTIISPKSKNIKAISLKESSKVIVKNLDILENLKDEYEKIFLNYKLNKCFL